MRKNDLVQIWVCGKITDTVDGQSEVYYTDMHAVELHTQWVSDFIERNIYGDILGGELSLYSKTLPAINKGDAIYLTKPEVVRRVEIEGKAIEDFGPGEYEAKSVKPAYMGNVHIYNPTVITIRRRINVEGQRVKST